MSTERVAAGQQRTTIDGTQAKGGTFAPSVNAKHAGSLAALPDRGQFIAAREARWRRETESGFEKATAIAAEATAKGKFLNNYADSFEVLAPSFSKVAVRATWSDDDDARYVLDPRHPLSQARDGAAPQEAAHRADVATAYQMRRTARTTQIQAMQAQAEQAHQQLAAAYAADIADAVLAALPDAVSVSFGNLSGEGIRYETANGDEYVADAKAASAIYSVAPQAISVLGAGSDGRFEINTAAASRFVIGEPTEGVLS